MNALLEFLPLVVFFVVYKYVGGLDAVYPATLAAILATLLTTAWTWWRYRQVARRQWVMLGVLLLLGGLTLALRDERYIKLKPTIVSWISAAVFLGSQFIGARPLIQRAYAGAILAPAQAWRRLNGAWVAFFVVLGALNLYVARHYSTDFWVDFKVFGILGLTLVFSVLQAFYLMRYDGTAAESPPDS
jgi:intracellular septation protein